MEKLKIVNNDILLNGRPVARLFDCDEMTILKLKRCLEFSSEEDSNGYEILKELYSSLQRAEVFVSKNERIRKACEKAAKFLLRN